MKEEEITPTRLDLIRKLYEEDQAKASGSRLWLAIKQFFRRLKSYVHL